jgi:50S ribosome-binding GTPase
MSASQVPSQQNPRIVKYRIPRSENERPSPGPRRTSLSATISDTNVVQPGPPPSQLSYDSLNSTSRRNTTPPRLQNAMAPVDGESWILVMGMTGSGKSHFINLLAEEKDRVRVGHSLISTTADVQDHMYRMGDGRTVRLLDTPGFDDTNRSDADVLQTIANALNELYTSGQRIDGVMYMHRIIDPRMSGAALKSLGIFRRICGKIYFPHIALVSTRWETLKGEEACIAAERRQMDLTDDPQFWADLVDGGSVTFRHDGSVKSAKRIVNNLLSRSRQASLKLQLEMSQGKTLAETEAGSFVEGAILKMKKTYEEEVERLRSEFKQAKVEGDLREEESALEQAEVVKAKIYGLEQDVASLHVDSRDLEDLHGSRRRRSSLAALDLEKALPGDEQRKMAMEVQSLEDRKTDLESNIGYLKKEEAALLRRNKDLEQEQESRRRLMSRNGQPYVELRRPSPNQVQQSERNRCIEKRPTVATKKERDPRMFEHTNAILRWVAPPTSPPPRSPRHSRDMGSYSLETQEQPPLRGIHRSRTLPNSSTFEQL